MPGIASLVVFLLAAIAAPDTTPAKVPSPAAPGADLVGVWEGVDTSSSGMGTILELTADGRFIQTNALLGNGYYRMIGNRLVVAEHPPKADADASDSPTVAIEGDILVETGPDGSFTRLERVGHAGGGPAIAGVWIDRRTASPTYDRFGEDGTYSRRMPMATRIDRYRFADGVVTVSGERRPTVELSVEAHGDRLFVRKSGDVSAHEFRRLAEIWYDRDLENLGAKRQLDPKWRLERAEAELAGAAGETARFNALPDAALLNAESGSAEKASALAEEVLRAAEKNSHDWNYGNAIHKGNLALGLVALHAGNVAEARSRLLAAGRTPGSPQLNSFGPNMVLARELVERKERDVVIEYFDLCRKFWKMDRGKLDEWTTQVRAGLTPQFGGNLLY